MRNSQFGDVVPVVCCNTKGGFADEVRVWFCKTWKARIAAELAKTSKEDEGHSAFEELMNDAKDEGKPWEALAADKTRRERVADRILKRRRDNNRREKELHQRIQELGETRIGYVEPSYGLDSQDAIEQIAKEVSFSPLERDFFKLYYLSHLDFSEIATTLRNGKTVEAVHGVEIQRFAETQTS
jgi:hypothetical protein